MIFQTIQSKAIALFASLTVAAVLAPAAYSQSGTELFLQNSASPACGGTTAAGFAGASELTSFSLNFSDLVATGTNSTATSAGRSSVSPMVVTKAIDGCSAVYITDLLLGQSVPVVVLTEMGRSGSSTQLTPMLTIELTNVFVSSFTFQNSITTTSSLEQMGLAFDSIKITSYTPGPNGTTQTKTVSYDYTLKKITEH